MTFQYYYSELSLYNLGSVIKPVIKGVVFNFSKNFVPLLNNCSSNPMIRLFARSSTKDNCINHSSTQEIVSLLCYWFYTFLLFQLI